MTIKETGASQSAATRLNEQYYSISSVNPLISNNRKQNKFSSAKLFPQNSASTDIAYYDIDEFVVRVEDLLKQLETDDIEECKKAADGLDQIFSNVKKEAIYDNRMFEAAKKTIMFLVNNWLQRQDKDDEVRGKAAVVLGEAAYVITGKLKSGSAFERLKTIELLYTITSILSHLLESGKESACVRNGAAEALNYMCIKSLPNIEEAALNDEDAKVRDKAAELLDDVIQTLVKVMKSGIKTKDTQECVRNILISLGTRAVPELSKMVATGDIETCKLAIKILKSIGWKAQEAIPALIGALEREDIQKEAIEALVSIGRSAALVIIEELKKDESFEKEKLIKSRGMVKVLGMLNNEDYADSITEDVVCAICHILLGIKDIRTGDLSSIAKVRDLACSSADALGNWGHKVKRALPTLRIIFETDESDAETPIVSKDVFTKVACSLIKIDPGSAVNYLKGESGLGNTKSPNKRHAAASAFAELGPAAAPAVDELMARLDDNDYFVRKSVIIALGRIGNGAKKALPKLREMLEHYSSFLHKHKEMINVLSEAIRNIER